MKTLILFLLLFSFISFAEDSYLQYDQSLKSHTYTVKKGDTLSQILNDHGFTGVYKNTDQNRHLNPIKLVMWKNGFKEEDLKNLEPGQVIYLPVIEGINRDIASTTEVQNEKSEGEVEDIPFQEVKKKVEEYASEENSFF